MNKFSLIAAIGLAVGGCKTACHDRVGTQPMGGPPRMVQKHGEALSETARPGGASPVLMYYQAARQNLWDAREKGFITSVDFANLTEKLQADMRLIFIEEAGGHRPAPPRRLSRQEQP